MLNFPEKKYDVIYADPPWSYNDKMKGHGMSLENHYETQDIGWIKSLPVPTIANKDCVLLLWAVSPQLPEAIDVINSWGFKFKTVAFVWSKHSSTGKKIHNMGRWTMGNVELCLLATKGQPNKWRDDKSVKQFVEAERFRHSQKPEEVRVRINKLFPTQTKIELFSRINVDGWDAWGNDPNLKENQNG